MRIFKIFFKRKAKFGDDSERMVIVKVPKPTGNIGIDAKTALNSYISSFGNLRKNEIIKMVEVDENDKQIGEEIRPMGESTIMPSAHKGVK